MAIFDAEVLSLGRPPFLPLALAADKPAIVRSRIKFRSNSASAPKMGFFAYPPEGVYFSKTPR